MRISSRCTRIVVILLAAFGCLGWTIGAIALFTPEPTRPVVQVIPTAVPSTATPTPSPTVIIYIEPVTLLVPTPTQYVPPPPTPTATPTVRPTPAPTSVVGPTVTPITTTPYLVAAGGSGQVRLGGSSASFGFGAGKVPAGRVEGWLNYRSEKGALQATALSSLDVRETTAGLWGFGTLTAQPVPVSFNVTVSPGAGGRGGTFRIVVYSAEGSALLSEEGAITSGAVTVTSRDSAGSRQ